MLKFIIRLPIVRGKYPNSTLLVREVFHPKFYTGCVRFSPFSSIENIFIWIQLWQPKCEYDYRKRIASASS